MVRIFKLKLIALLGSIFLSINLLAADCTIYKVDDNLGKLTQQESERITSRLKNLCHTLGIGMVIKIIDTYPSDERSYTKEQFNEYGLTSSDILYVSGIEAKRNNFWIGQKIYPSHLNSDWVKTTHKELRPFYMEKQYGGLYLSLLDKIESQIASVEKQVVQPTQESSIGGFWIFVLVSITVILFLPKGMNSFTAYQTNIRQIYLSPTETLQRKNELRAYLSVKYPDLPIWKAYLRECRLRKKQSISSLGISGSNSNYDSNMPLYLVLFLSPVFISEFNSILPTNPTTMVDLNARKTSSDSSSSSCSSSSCGSSSCGGGGGCGGGGCGS